ncbi:unnamed protein product, partial [marine sediment metagenome]
LLGEDKLNLTKHYTENTEAYNLYLEGLFLLNTRGKEEMKRGIAFFQMAIDKDPQYALAYAGLADSYSLMAFWGFMSPEEAYQNAVRLTEKALEIDDTIAEVHSSLGFIKMTHDYDWGGAEKEYKRAIELNPSHSISHFWYGAFSVFMNKFEKGYREIKKGLEVDPLSLIINSHLVDALRVSNRIDEAIEQAEKTIAMNPKAGITYYYLGKAYLQKGQLEKAIAAFEKSVALRNFPYANIALPYSYAKYGETEKARKIIHEMETKAKKEYVPLAMYYI